MSQSNNFRNIPNDIKVKAEQVVDLLGLSDFAVKYDSATKTLAFKKGFKEMHVSLVLVEREQWSDIRQAYRAVFQPGPQVENFGAQNEWSRWTDK